MKMWNSEWIWCLTAEIPISSLLFLLSVWDLLGSAGFEANDMLNIFRQKFFKRFMHIPIHAHPENI